MAKGWNDVLNYVKSFFTNQEIELSDTEILTHFQNHTLPEFSIWAPRRYRVTITNENLVDEELGIYEIPIPEDENFDVIDIYTWYPNVTSSTSYYSGSGGFNYLPNTLNAALTAWLGDASNTSPQLYPIIDPNNPRRVMFNAHSDQVDRYLPAVLDLKVTHTSPITIPTEIYYRWFKPYCYADFLILLGTIRSKFQQLSTPIGQVLTNAENLISQGIQMKEQIKQELQRLYISNPIIFG